ncbi:hypothetical protein D6745_04685 [Candidatus Woesearchaeota archaeon]|nr:MAG: hypothetical protein D6745_04685 [Candidatus Woesearchaeota archaeon]
MRKTLILLIGVVALAISASIASAHYWGYDYRCNGCYKPYKHYTGKYYARSPYWSGVWYTRNYYYGWRWQRDYYNDYECRWIPYEGFRCNYWW